MSRAITVEHLAKRYRLGALSSATFQADFARWWARARRRPDPLAAVGHDDRSRHQGQEFWALKDVSFDVREGEVLGVIGRNGAGKSTLLKILSQITAPTSGQVTLRGRVASLLEVGTGFHPELTGRENVFLNGAILGMTAAEIRDNFDAIVAFSECEAFIDTPVKRYSSGMYVRLAFAVAAHLESEILIVDEVLAVGDAQFQRKCLGKMGDIASHGRTILFVSHSMAAVSALCTRAMLLRDGAVEMIGEVEQVAAAYQRQSSGELNGLVDVSALPRVGNGKARFLSLKATPMAADGSELHAATTGCDLEIEVTLECHAQIEDANVSVELSDAIGYRLIDANLASNGTFITLRPGDRARIGFRLRELLLKPGLYQIALWIGRPGRENIDYVQYAAGLSVHDDVTRTKHSETYPGVYLCRYTHRIDVQR